jgi:glutamate/tyrosine decarboxylase-like PLP-dependent enzyme
MADAADRHSPELLREAAERAIHYLEGLERRAVGPRADAVAGLARFREPMPDSPSDAAATLRLLDDAGSPATMAMAGPRFFGFVIGGSLPVTVASNWLSCAWDQNSGLRQPTPATALIEEVALGWLVDLFGLPPGTGGGFVTGASRELRRWRQRSSRAGAGRLGRRG